MGRFLLLASIVATNLTPALGQIGANYFDTLKQSQVWVNVEPRLVAPGDPGEVGPGPVEMNFTVAFPGRNLPSAPAEVELRVHAYCLRFPTRIRVPELTIVIDGLDLPLTGPGQPFTSFGACGDQSTFDGVSVRVPFATVRRMAAAGRVEVRALGFGLALTPEDRRALGLFVAAVTGGVTLR